MKRIVILIILLITTSLFIVGCNCNKSNKNTNYISNINNIDDYPIYDNDDVIDEIRTPEQIFLNTPNSKSYISVGDYCWMEFTAPSTGEYYFSFHYGQYNNQYINGSNIIVDVFSSVVSGHSFNNYIQSYSMGYLLNNGITTGVYFHKTLNAQENIFLRVRGNNWCGLFPSITYMISDYEISEVVHVH